MLFEWDSQKNEKLKCERGISFEEIEAAINNGFVLDEKIKPNYPRQRIQLVNINNYVWAVPSEQRGDKVRLITAYQSRALTKEYL